MRYGKDVPCIGGPLHGAMTDPDLKRLKTVIPPERMMVWGRPLPLAHYLNTEYEIRRVAFDWGALRLEGLAYVWVHARYEPQALLMSILAHMAAGAPWSIKEPTL